MQARSVALLAVGIGGIALGAWLSDAIRTPIVIAATLLLPGALVTLAVFGHRVNLVEGIALSLVLSMAVLILGGIVLGLYGIEIEAVSWAVYLAVVVIAAAAAAYRSRRQARSVVLWRPPLRDVGFVLGGLVAIGFGLTVSANSTEAAWSAGPEPVPELWISRDEAELENVTVGVMNLGGVEERYVLELFVDDEAARTVDLTLGPNEEWTSRLDVSRRVVRVDAHLSRDDGGMPIRHVWTVSGG